MAASSKPRSGKSSASPIVCHVISSTHWDRAWYLPFEKFRLRLIEMIDEMFTLFESDKEFKSFFFDGQIIPIEDYLAIKPHRREAIREAARRGQLILGPHYVLPDEFLVSGESLVRNLLIGRKVTSELGPVARVGYMPDSFGHVSQIPQLLRGFGIDNFIFMRGADQKVKALGAEFTWKAPDGKSEVLAIHPVHGYGNARALGHPLGDMLFQPYDTREACDHADRLVKSIQERSRLPEYLLVNGMDHQPAQRSLSRAIREINRHAAGRYQLVHSTPEKFLATVRKANLKLKSYQGELLGGAEHWILSGVYSARLYLKRANYQCQMLLERQTEPLATVLNWEGYPYPADQLTHAWKTLLQCHPHDDICGCSVDEVHRDMNNRFAHVEQVGEWLRDRALDHLLFQIALPGEESGAPLLVFNTLAWERNEFVRAVVELPAADADEEKELELVDSRNRLVPATFAALEKPYRVDWAWGEEERRKVRVEFVARDIPAGGFEVYRLRRTTNPQGVPLPEPPGDMAVRDFPKGLENAWLRIEAKPNGSIEIMDKETGRMLARTNVFEDLGDRGDEYDFDPVVGDTPLYSEGMGLSWAIVQRGPERLVARLDQVFHIPEGIERDRSSRMPARVEIPLRTEVILSAHTRRVDFRVSFVNQATDHRLRVGVEVPGQTDHVWVESKFDVRKRGIGASAETWAQPPKPTAPQDGWAALEMDGRGIAIFNKGLPEYEVERHGDSMRYWLTILRSVGWLSRNDLQTRHEHAGPGLSTPEAQCRGEHHVEFSLLPYKGGWDSARVPRRAQNYLTPPATFSFFHAHRLHRGSHALAPRHSFYAVEPTDILVSAVKQSESGKGTVLRLWNSGVRMRRATITVDRPVRFAHLLRLDETPVEALKIGKSGSSVTVELRPKEIATVELAWRAPRKA